MKRERILFHSMRFYFNYRLVKNMNKYSQKLIEKTYYNMRFNIEKSINNYTEKKNYLEREILYESYRTN